MNSEPHSEHATDHEDERPARIEPLGGGKRLRSFSVTLSIVLTAFTVGVFVWLGVRTESLVRMTALEQARSYTDTIIAARGWNSRLGGVWVVKSATVLTNPYLVDLGVQADDNLSDGTPVTLRNPAAMTREIGELMETLGSGAQFKLTSLEPVNPDNAPDAWERLGLEAFQRGASEYSWQGEDSSGEQVFRYMRSLVVDESCLTCHAGAGYKVGDVRGAVSSTLSYGSHARALKSSSRGLLAIGAAVLVILWVGLLGMIRWLKRGLKRANEQLEYMATTDPLTGLWNRRHLFGRLEAEMARVRRQQGSVGVVMIDIDHFKRFNDSFGHAAGDRVLQLTARAIESAIRTYDIVGRIGGEELLVIASDIDPAELKRLSERIRQSVEGMNLSAVCPGCTITVSAGAAIASADAQETADSLAARADAALYAAKEAGRNRVVMA
jgi:diguanylate cyclase (GGDEF)-like protein